MSDPNPPLDDELQNLLDVDRDVDSMPSDLPDRLWERLDQALPGGGGGGGGEPTPPSAGPAIGVATHALALIVGVSAGFGLHELVDAEPPMIVAVAPIESAPVETPPIEDHLPVVPVEELIEEVVEIAPTRDRVFMAPERVAPGRAPSTLAEERVGLEIARTALGRRAYDDALAALRAHQRRYPRSRLAEEREVLFIRSLASDGQRSRAAQRAQVFRARFPQSMFLGALEGIE